MNQSKRTSPSSSLAPRWIAVGLIAFGVTYSCVEREEEADASPSRTEFLETAAACIQDATIEWTAVATELEERVAAWADAPDDEDALEAAQSAWNNARESWQRFAPLAAGPAGSSNSVESGGAIGGLDLAEQIYSWPSINACRVDQGLESESYTDGVGELAVNARGLDSLEYLLFYQGAETACPPTASIVSEGTWEAIEDLPARRAAYAQKIAVDIVSLSEQLESEWSESGFAGHLVAAGDSGPYETQSDAIKAVTDALFYVEKVVKDEKLAIGLGISDVCSEDACPEDFEHQQSGASKASIADNFVGFALMFNGCAQDDEQGLDWLLREEGAEMLADNIQSALGGIDTALEAIEEDDLVEAFEEDPDSVIALHDAVKVLTDLLKNDLVITLGVTVPGSIGGDND